MVDIRFSMIVIIRPKNQKRLNGECGLLKHNSMFPKKSNLSGNTY
jgi:hypothetical protein